MKSVKIPLPALGVDLLSDETGLPDGAVRRAENIDIRRNGSFQRRQGYSVAVAGADFHSLFSSRRGVLVGRGSKVYALDTTTFGPTLLCDMGAHAPVDFTEYNGHTYLINRSSFWWIPGDASAARRVGVALPDRIPDVVAAETGALPAGRYVVALSCTDDRGEESPTKIIGQVHLPAGGGVQLTNIESSLQPGAYRVYLSPPDGDALYLAEEFSRSFGQYLVTQPGDGAIRSSQHLAPMPAGEFVRATAGRIFVATGDTLYYSEPLRPHLHDPRHNFITFQGRIRFIEALVSGLFVGDDRGVWWLPGTDPTQFSLRLASSALPVARSSVLVNGAHFSREITTTDLDVAVWLSSEGYVLGRPSGDAVSLHPERVRVAADLEGRSVFLIRDGIKQIITLVAATNGLGYGVAIDTTIQ